MGGTRVGLVAMIVLSLAAGFGEAQEIGQPGHGLALAQRLCSQCHAVGKEQTQSPNENSPPFQVIAYVPGMEAMTWKRGAFSLGECACSSRTA